MILSFSNNLKEFPWYGYLSIIIIIVTWYLNWTLDGLRTHYLFFSLWLGYSLFVDALVKKIKGNSLLSRNWKKYVTLFLISIPVWWFFELLNQHTQNWHYLGRENFSDIEYFFYASLNFSTVIPAVFGSAELVSTIKWVKNAGNGPRIPSNKAGLTGLILMAIVSLFLMFSWPSVFYMFVWIAPFLILDVINHISGNRSLVFYSNNRNWKPMISLALGALLCGFFWEMWNYYSNPKWIYNTPGVEFLYVFEMPLLGYLGYIPFSFELFAFYHLITGTKRKIKNTYYLQIEPPVD